MDSWPTTNLKSTTQTWKIIPHGQKAGPSVSSQGLEVLGAPIGSQHFVKEFNTDKFFKIRSIVEQFTNIAKLFPQRSLPIS